MQRKLEKTALREAVAKTGTQVELVCVRWDRHTAVVVVVEVKLRLNLHFAKDVGQDDLAEAETLGLEDAESNEVQDTVEQQEDGKQVDHRVAHHSHLHMGAEHSHLEELALETSDMHEDEGRMHKRGDGRHRHEGIREEAELPWCRVKRQPLEIG